jgi:hypothetical protein
VMFTIQKCTCGTNAKQTGDYYYSRLSLGVLWFIYSNYPTVMNMRGCMIEMQGGKRNPRLHMVGVSHTGIRLLTRLKDQFQDYIDVQHHIKSDISVTFSSLCL